MKLFIKAIKYLDRDENLVESAVYIALISILSTGLVWAFINLLRSSN